MADRDRDPRKIAARLRGIADQFDLGETVAVSDDPEIDAVLRIYRDACPLVSRGLRAYADTLVTP